jgi:calcineurin-like phosphoesterase family protein
LADIDREALEANGGTWHDGNWKGGKRSSRHRLSREAVEMMDETIIANINANVGTDDILWHLGDFAMPGKQRYERMCRYYRDRLHCQNIYLVWGNHDERFINKMFQKTYDKLTAKINGQSIVMCHEAFAIWDKSHRGAWNLYGHSHAAAEKWLDEILPGRRSMDVGVDNAYRLTGEFRPFSFDEIRKIMEKRPGVNVIKKNGPPEEELVG